MQVHSLLHSQISNKCNTSQYIHRHAFYIAFSVDEHTEILLTDAYKSFVWIMTNEICAGWFIYHDAYLRKLTDVNHIATMQNNTYRTLLLFYRISYRRREIVLMINEPIYLLCDASSWLFLPTFSCDILPYFKS